MANKRRITKVSRVFPCIYTYTATWEKAAGTRKTMPPAPREYQAMTKTRSSFLSLCVLLLTAAAFIPRSLAQTLVATQVLTSPAGPWFTVDGTTFYSGMSAFWPVGSQHTLGINSGTGFAYNLDATIQWQFQQWQWKGGASAAPTIQVITDPSIDQYNATFAAQYLFTVQIVCNPGPCQGSPGTYTVNGNAPPVASSWQTPGSVLTLQAFPSFGWIFAGWQAANGPLVPSVWDSVTLNAPKIGRASCRERV